MPDTPKTRIHKQKDITNQEFLTPLQIARLMGLSKATIRKYCQQGIIPHTKLGNGNHNASILIPKYWVKELLTQAEESVR